MTNANHFLSIRDFAEYVNFVRKNADRIHNQEWLSAEYEEKTDENLNVENQ